MHSPFSTAFTSGTRFAQDTGEPIEVSRRGLGQLQVPSGRLVVGDPATTDLTEPLIALARQAPTGVFPVEVAVACFGSDLRVACARVRFRADEPATVWEVAGFEGGPSDSGDSVPAYGVDAGMACFFDARACAGADHSEEITEAWLAAVEQNSVPTWAWHVAELGGANIVMFSSGWGDGLYSSYWGLDDSGRIVELVTDFEVLIGPASERVELPLPLSPGRIEHPLLEQHDVRLRAPRLARHTAILGGTGTARVELTDGSPVTMKRRLGKRRYTWSPPAPASRLVVAIMTGLKPLDPL